MNTSQLSSLLAQKLDSILEYFGVELQHLQKYSVGRCPLHGGSDNERAFNIYRYGDVPGYWVCRSNGCESVFRSTILGFVRGLLSVKQLGWSNKSDKIISFAETLIWCEEFLNIKIDSQYEGETDTITKYLLKKNEPRAIFKLEDVAKNLEIPSPQMMERGLAGEILTKYYVGTCNKPNKPFYQRVVFPLINRRKNYAIGFVGRSLFGKCELCGAFHSPKLPCPAQDKLWIYSKYKNSQGLNSGELLYNYIDALPQIEKTGEVILVEGVVDCLKLVQAGYTNSVAILGDSLTDYQQKLLNYTHALTVKLLLDNDDAGISATKKITAQLKRQYNIEIPKISPAKKDVGELTIEEIHEVLK